MCQLVTLGESPKRLQARHTERRGLQGPCSAAPSRELGPAQGGRRGTEAGSVGPRGSATLSPLCSLAKRPPRLPQGEATGREGMAEPARPLRPVPHPALRRSTAPGSQPHTVRRAEPPGPAQEEPGLTELNAGVGRRERFLCHAPVEGVTVAVVRVEEGGEVPGREPAAGGRPEPLLPTAAPRLQGPGAPGVCPPGA